MELTLIAPAFNPHKPNSYEVEVNTMMGDADGYTSFTAGPFMKGVDEERLENFLQTLEIIKAAYPYGRGGDDDFNHLVPFIAWFDTSAWEDEAEFMDNFNMTAEDFKEFTRIRELAGEMYLDWPIDPTGFDGRDSSYESHKVVFYNENCVAYDVKVTL